LKMRVIAGQFRSRPLASLPGMDVRPTANRLRETLFDVLLGGDPERLRGSAWFDLYAGTGAVGIEALSRGAAKVYFVESSPRAAGVIRRNLASLGVPAAQFVLLTEKVGQAVRRLRARGVLCDFCFLDPPYRLCNAYRETLDRLPPVLKPTSLVIAEHDKKYDPGATVGALERYRLLRQGDAGLSFYRVKSAANENEAGSDPASSSPSSEG
jgi:16S rRNA (guanine966-N2)-methyltransferase